MTNVDPNAFVDFNAFIRCLRVFDMHKRPHEIEDAMSMVTEQNAHHVAHWNNKGLLWFACLYCGDIAALKQIVNHLTKMGAAFDPECFANCCVNVERVVPPVILRFIIDTFSPATINHNWGRNCCALYYAFDYDQVECAKILLDFGAKLENVIEDDSVSIPQWAKDFDAGREKTRAATLVVLGASKTSKINNRNRDVMRIIARCIWSTRGYEIW